MQSEVIRAELESRLERLKARYVRIDDHLHNRGRDVPSDSQERAAYQQNEQVVEALEPVTLNEIAAIEEAIARLDRDEWAECATCGKAIEPRRLLLLPSTDLCASCAHNGAQDDG